MLTRVFPADVVDAVIERTGALQQQNRLLPSRLMVYYIMFLALFSNRSYEEVKHHAGGRDGIAERPVP